ncbi:hypothetical protein AB0K16_22610 [Nonomuraea jabiensis]|uniref:hypothetical protein n=1 Tax=Nonomuraea jabiensis TaxID=882448 RepID=UPI0034157A4F
MKKFKTLLVGVAAVVTLGIGGGVALATAASRTNTTAGTTAEPVAYGLCVNVKTKGVRFLQVDDLAKSRYGACKQDGSEQFVSLLSGEAKYQVPKLPAQVVYTYGGKYYLCSVGETVKLRAKLANGTYGKVVSPARFDCVEAVRPWSVPRPTVTPSTTVSPVQ